jgi:transcriptional regulator with XRE-family HTH domain
VDIKRTVGREIRAARKAKGLSQLALAERSDLSADFIGKVERGTTSPSLESLKAIATALNLSLGDLFVGELAAAPLQEALIELIQMCRGHPNENIALIVEVARPILQRLRSHGDAASEAKQQGGRPAPPLNPSFSAKR